jgi:hypothetical protein
MLNKWLTGSFSWVYMNLQFFFALYIAVLYNLLLHIFWISKVVWHKTSLWL